MGQTKKAKNQYTYENFKLLCKSNGVLEARNKCLIAALCVVVVYAVIATVAIWS